MAKKFEKCPLCLFYVNEATDVTDASKEKVYFEGDWVYVHTSCAETYRDITLDASSWQFEDAELEAAKINFECGTQIFDRCLETNILNGRQYIVGKLSKKAASEGNSFGVFAVASLNYDTREYEEIYKLDINCNSDTVYKKTANFVLKHLDIHKQLHRIMSNKFIEEIEKFAEKQEYLTACVR